MSAVLPEIRMRSFDASLPMALLKAREASMRLFRPMLAEHGLTEQQFRVLRALASAETPLEIGDIASRTLLLGPSLARILAHLKRTGLVARRSVAHDQRRAEISLTTRGRRLVAEIAPKSEALYARIEEHMGGTKLQQLMRLLTQMAELDAGEAMEEAS
jgi:homoprotocatechuate degradation regulator HpaR